MKCKRETTRNRYRHLVDLLTDNAFQSTPNLLQTATTVTRNHECHLKIAVLRPNFHHNLKFTSTHVLIYMPKVSSQFKYGNHEFTILEISTFIYFVSFLFCYSARFHIKVILLPISV